MWSGSSCGRSTSSPRPSSAYREAASRRPRFQPSLGYLGYEPGSLPETERVAQENFSVPLWPGMPVEAQERVVDVVRSAVGVAASA